MSTLRLASSAATSSSNSNSSSTLESYLLRLSDDTSISLTQKQDCVRTVSFFFVSFFFFFIGVPFPPPIMLEVYRVISVSHCYPSEDIYILLLSFSATSLTRFHSFFFTHTHTLFLTLSHTHIYS